MRRLIAQLRQTRPQDQAFDTTIMELMRDVMRHIADEETMLLPDAERVLGERRLEELGAEMTQRRSELAGPRAGELAAGAVRTFPAAALALAGLFVLGAFLVGRSVTRPAPRPVMLRALGAPREWSKAALPHPMRKSGQVGTSVSGAQGAPRARAPCAARARGVTSPRGAERAPSTRRAKRLPRAISR